MYRRIGKDEKVDHSTDLLVEMPKCMLNFYIRPLRDVDDLTDEELSELLWYQNDANNYRYLTDKPYKKDPWTPMALSLIRGALKISDELRSRPKETEKERWIKKYPMCNMSPDVKQFALDTWDAAYEAGRKAK